MNNPLLEMLDGAINQIEQEDKFVIDSDERAEWALTKIREEKAEADRIISLCDKQIDFYREQANKAQDALERKTGGLEAMLLNYFQTVPHKATKTQETYSLPSGKLKLKFPGPEYVQDKDKLLAWLKDHEMTDYIKTIESPQWGELKKAVVQHDNKVCYDGEIVEGITLLERDPEFEVDI